MVQVSTTVLTDIIVTIRERIVTDYRGNRDAIMPLPPSTGSMPPDESDWVMPLMSLASGGCAEDMPRAALRCRFKKADGQDCGSAVIEIIDRMPKTPYEIQSSDVTFPPVRLLRLSVGKNIQGETGHEDRYTTLYAVVGESGFPGGFNYVEYRAYAPLVMDAFAQFNEAVAELPLDGISFREDLRVFA